MRPVASRRWGYRLEGSLILHNVGGLEPLFLKGSHPRVEFVGLRLEMYQGLVVVGFGGHLLMQGSQLIADLSHLTIEPVHVLAGLA